MTNQYLTEIHDHITKELDQCIESLLIAEQNKEEKDIRFYKGQIDELKAFKTFIGENYNLETQSYP